jgi:hypothetical protein
MPYIKPELRLKVEKELYDLIHAIAESGNSKEEIAPMLAYVFYKLLIVGYGAETDNWYKRMDAIKILESVKEEFLQHRIRPYELQKRKENGTI